MKVILLTELRGKGGEGDVIDVAQGYAENYLFRQGIALPATKGNLKQLEERRRNIQKREIRRIEDAEAVRGMLEGKLVEIDARVGEEGQLYGSVTAPMIADAIQEQLGITVDRRRVELNTPIKTAGLHVVDVNLYREINASVQVQVGKPEEAPVEDGASDEALATDEDLAGVQLAEDAAALAVAEQEAEAVVDDIA